MMTNKQIETLERYIISLGKGLFKDVEVTIDEYNYMDVGIYIDWGSFPKKHGVYKIKDSYIINLREKIKSVLKVLDVKTSKYIIISIEIKNNFDEIPDEGQLNEIERDWRDKKYEEQYDRISEKLNEFIYKMIKSCYEDDTVVHLYDENDNRIITFYKKNNELFYNRDISDYITNLVPPFIWARHDKYAISDTFESIFPDYKVRDVIAAGMSN